MNSIDVANGDSPNGRFSAKSSTFAALVIVGVVVLLPMVYIAAYYAALDTSHLPFPDGSYLLFSPARCRFGGDVSAVVFYPAYYIDANLVRPDVWDPWDPTRVEVTFD